MSFTGVLGTIPNPQQPLGSGGDQVFFQNGQTVTQNYTIPANTNAGSFGPITVSGSVVITIPASSSWTVV